jgi:hypothetical protein
MTITFDNPGGKSTGFVLTDDDGKKYSGTCTPDSDDFEWFDTPPSDKQDDFEKAIIDEWKNP